MQLKSEPVGLSTALMDVNLESQPMDALFLMLGPADGQVQPTEAESVTQEFLSGSC